MTPEPRPSLLVEVTFTVATELKVFAATALAVEVSSSLGLMVMDWLEPVV